MKEARAAQLLELTGRVVNVAQQEGASTPYAGRVKRTAGISSLLVALALWASLAYAHEDQEFHLAGATFCVDPASVQVELELPNRARAESAQTILERNLTQMLTATLERSGVTFEIQDSCAQATDYTLLVANVRYLDPKNYVGFGKQAHSYALFLQVGGYTSAVSVELTQQLPSNRYTAYLSEIYAEGDEGRPFEPFVVDEGVKVVQALTAYWWEDNPRRSLQALLLPPLVGTFLALLSGVAIWWALRRRSRRKRTHSLSG